MINLIKYYFPCSPIDLELLLEAILFPKSAKKTFNNKWFYPQNNKQPLKEQNNRMIKNTKNLKKIHVCLEDKFF